MIGAGLALALLAGALLFSATRPPAATAEPVAAGTCGPIEAVADEGRDHLQPFETPTYRANPPSSGTHNPVSELAGVYTSPRDITKLVHSLEHGYIVIQYRDLNPAEFSALSNLVQSDPTKIIANPYPTNPARVVLTAWDYAQKCDGVSEEAIRQFIGLYRNKGPEPGGM